MPGPRPNPLTVVAGKLRGVEDAAPYNIIQKGAALFRAAP